MNLKSLSLSFITVLCVVTAGFSQHIGNAPGFSRPIFSLRQQQSIFPSCPNGQCQIQTPPIQLAPAPIHLVHRVFPSPQSINPIVVQPLEIYPVEVQPPAMMYSVLQQSVDTIILNPLREEVSIDSTQLEAVANVRNEDRFDQITRATVRVTVSGVCGSGTVVGRDNDGNAIVLTNAHVAGTTRGRVVNLERWNTDGSGERGQGAIIAAGYGRGMSVDFALLKCNAEFAIDVTPIPLADRYPDANRSVTTFGCPRCEWPSLQVLKMNRSEGQVLTWKPEAIGGRSGSSLVEHTEAGPRVVGLLTWGGGGEGLGQSTPFLLSAMRGKLPKSLETLPKGVREVAFEDHASKKSQSILTYRDERYATCPYPRTKDDRNELAVFQVPATTGGAELKLPIAMSMTSKQTDDEIVDSITEEGLRDRLRPTPDIEDDCTENGLLNRERTGPVRRGAQWLGQWILVIAFGAACLFIGFVIGKNKLR